MSDHGWVALLRAINLGARNKVAMAELRRLFQELGCGDVRTYIQSGNVVFTSSSPDRVALARQLEDAVNARFGVPARVILRTFAEVRRVADSHPFGAETSNTHVAFLAEEPTAESVRRLEAADIAPDRFALAGRDVFLHYPDGVQGSRLSGALLERNLGVAATVRNWNTVTRLAEMATAAEVG